MSNCVNMHCPHVNNETGACSFNGECIVKEYNLAEMNTVNKFLCRTTIREEIEDKPEAIAISTIKVVPQAGFNPFQRGNGCMLSEKSSIAKTR